MDSTTIAAAFAGESAAKVQSATAMKMLKMNAEAGQSLAAMLRQNAESLAQLVREQAAADGVGATLDTTA